MKKIRCMAALMVCGGVLAARAALLAGTPEGAPYAGRVAIGDYGFGAGYPILQARPFGTGSQDCQLVSVWFGSQLYWEGGAGALSLSIYADSGGVPGSPVAGGLALFSASAATVDQMLYPSSSLLLMANTTYWLVASADQSQGATRYWWNLTDSALFESALPGAGLPLARANDAGGWAAYSGASMQVAIQGTAVPEPATLSFFGLGGIGTFLLRGKRRRRSCSGAVRSYETLVYRTSFLEEERAAPALAECH